MKIDEYFKSFFSGTKDPSLDAMKFFMERFGNPEKKLKFIHVAGTNGKGSTVEMLSSILINAGYKVGKYISPCLERFNEKMSVDNTPISDKEIDKLIKKIDPIVEEFNKTHNTKVTQFEAETTMAILYFYYAKCDIVILEVGLGGLYDCTNIVNPIASIISSIGMDHMNILGNTIEEITEQKAGIIKTNSNTIFFKHENENVNKIIREKCASVCNKLILLTEKNISNYKFGKNLQSFDYKSTNKNYYKNLKINLKGKIQTHNAAAVVEAVEILNNSGFKILRKSIREGLKSVVHKGRFEVLNTQPLIVYEGGHNEQAINNFKENIQLYYPGKGINIVYQVLDTKDYKKTLDSLSENPDWHIICTNGIDKKDGYHKYVDKNVLVEYMRKKNRYNNEALEIEDAIESIFENRYDVNVILGSFYIYAGVVKEVKKLSDRS